ncbi:hypothetical protein GCM10010191_00800 [Actinomadura vinacea]|uniref:Uncharacterized protein n=1 Tax=Actinomadura vinacea TaxID=115336 RepID=A0ABP5VE70_9ACTN
MGELKALRGVEMMIDGRGVTIVQPYDTVPRLFNVRDAADGQRLAILLDLGRGRWRGVRTDLGDPMNPTMLDAEDVQEAARLTLRL